MSKDKVFLVRLKGTATADDVGDALHVGLLEDEADSFTVEEITEEA